MRIFSAANVGDVMKALKNRRDRMNSMVDLRE